jgi:DNA-binding NarL/FixJ family response regulator
MNKITVMIVDDHPPFSQGLSRLLMDEADLEVVANSPDGEEAVKLTTQLHPDVAIIDVAMPKMSGIEVARQIKATSPSTAILMLSAYDYESYLLPSLQAGARGYLLKTSPLRELISAVRLVHSGQAVFTSKAANRFLNRLAIDNGKERLGGLHNRELQILRLVAQGKANKEIARELVISDRTVQTHLVAIFRKLGVGSRTEAVARALKEGWLTLDDLP